MKNKSVVVVMCLVLIFTSVINYSQVNAEKRKPDYIEIRENSELENVSDEILNNTEAIVVSDELEKQNIEELNEVMDNGTGIIIEGDTVEEVQDYFNVDTKVSSENEMGCYVYKNGEDVSVAPIECDIMLDDEKNESATATDIRSIIENEEIDYEQVISDYEALKSEDKLKKISNKKIAMLQSSTDLGNSFMDNDKFVYFYKKGTSGGISTKYQYNSKESVSGWSKIGSVSFLIYAIKIKTKGNTTYDNIEAITRAGALASKYVVEFRNGISVDSSSRNHIIDCAEIVGNDNESKSASISTGVNSSGEASISASKQYSYNPNGMNVKLTEWKYRKRWTCMTGNDESENRTKKTKEKSYTIKPSILVKKTNGKSNAITVTSYVSYFQLHGGFRTYTNQDTISCSIKFKNHKKA